MFNETTVSSLKEIYYSNFTSAPGLDSGLELFSSVFEACGLIHGLEKQKSTLV